MRGLSAWMCSQVMPMRSSAPGAKFSTSTSQVLISRSSTALTLRALGVDRHRALVVVEHREVQAVDIGDVAQLSPRRIALARSLDLDHVGAEPGQQLRAGRARLHMREVEDANAFQCLAHRADLALPCQLGLELGQALLQRPLVVEAAGLVAHHGDDRCHLLVGVEQHGHREGDRHRLPRLVHGGHA